MNSYAFLGILKFDLLTKSGDASLRSQSEQILKELQSPQNLELCRTVLEHSTEPLAQFHASVLIREILVSPQYKENRAGKQEWVNYLLSFLEVKFQA
jgi:hypothetical protein